MTFPAIYLLLWCLILGAAVAYAAEWIEVSVCAISGKEHPSHGQRFLLRRSAVVGIATARDVKRAHCTELVMANGKTLFIKGTYEENETRVRQGLE